MERYTDVGPSLGSSGTAYFRQEPSRLRVAYATASTGQEKEMVDVVVRTARLRRMQVHWTVVPERLGEHDLSHALHAAGFALSENLLLMAYEGPLAVSLNPHVHLAPITSWQEMWTYEYGSRRSFYDDPRPSDALVNKRASERWQEIERGWCHYYVAELSGQQIGGCYVSAYEDVPTIMGVYTLPEARGAGVATALLARAVDDSLRQRKEICCLFVEHGNPAERLYHTLGFEPICDFRTYTWDPSRRE
jgi:GNAT superfamily N-acetyltransferase